MLGVEVYESMFRTNHWQEDSLFSNFQPNLSSDSIKLELSSPSRAGIISPSISSDDNEDIIMLVMPIMLN